MWRKCSIQNFVGLFILNFEENHVIVVQGLTKCDSSDRWHAHGDHQLLGLRPCQSKIQLLQDIIGNLNCNLGG
jgi:hypothetical protein